MKRNGCVITEAQAQEWKTQDLKELNNVHNTCHILDKKHQLKAYKINHNADIPGSEKQSMLGDDNQTYIHNKII
jgi:hypothetical protein